MNKQKLILHICPRKGWLEALDEGNYRAPSLEIEGFIHCSRSDQLLEVANSIYRDIPDLLLLWIDPKKVNADIKYEQGSERTNQRYPHIYGPLNLDAVLAISDFAPGTDGVFQEVPEFVRYRNI